MKEWNDSNGLKADMKKEAKRLGISIGNVYNTYTARTLLQRISKHNDGGILIKGSSAEIAYLQRPVRAITDVDIALLDTLKVNEKLLNEVLNDESNDNLHFVIKKGPKRTKTGIAKFTLEAQAFDMRQPLGIDIQENYDRLIEPQSRIMPSLFEGDKDFEMLVPSFEEYLAEKLCIILGNNKMDVPNTRVKDFYDVYQLHGGKYDAEKLTEYFKIILEHLGKVDLDTAKTLHLNKDYIDKHKEVWEHNKERYDFLDQDIDLEGAVYYTRAVLREQLQKNGQEMANNLPKIKIKGPRK